MKAECCTHLSVFPESYRSTADEMKLLEDAAKGLMKSGAIKVVFSMLVQLGNYVNHGTNRGNAWGFTLDSIEQLARVQSFKSKEYTLVHALCEELWTNSRLTYRAFMDDTALCDDAARFELDEMKRKVTDLERQVAFVKKEIVDHPQATTKYEEKFRKPMCAFVDKNEVLVAELRGRVTELEATGKKMITFFCCRPNTAMSAIMKTFGRFRKTMMEATRANQERQLKEKKKLRQEQEKLRLEEEKLKKSEGVDKLLTAVGMDRAGKGGKDKGEKGGKEKGGKGGIEKGEKGGKGGKHEIFKNEIFKKGKGKGGKEGKEGQNDN